MWSFSCSKLLWLRAMFVWDARMLMFMVVHRAKSIEAERQCHVFGWSRHCEEYDRYDSAG